MKRNYAGWMMIGVAAVVAATCTAIKVIDMPIDSTLNTTDWFYEINQGSTSSRMSGQTLMEVIGDTADDVRTQLFDSITAVRALSAGGGAWSKDGNYIYPTDEDDSIGIGTTSPDHLFHVNGKSYITRNYADTFAFPNNVAKIYSDISGYLYLKDYSGTYSLSTVGSLFGLDADPLYTATYYPLNSAFNWHFGSTAQTAYKVQVTGAFRSTGNTDVTSSGSYLRFPTSGGTFTISSPRISSSSDKLYFSDEDGTFTLGDLSSGGLSDEDTLNHSGGSTNGIYINNTGLSGMKIHNQSTGEMGMFIDNYATGTAAGLRIDASNTSGYSLRLGNGGSYVFSVGRESDEDSVWFHSFAGAATGTRFFIPTSTGAIDTGTLVNARIGLKMRLRSFFLHIMDRKNGELKYYWEDKDGKIHSQYGLKGLGLEGIQAIAVSTEHILRWMLRQWFVIIFLIIWCIRLEIKLRKR